MRVVMMMRDREYRDALIETISGFDKDIFIEVAGTSGIRRDAVIVTDIRPDEIEQSSLQKIQDRTLFLTNNPALHSKDRIDHPGSADAYNEDPGPLLEDSCPHMIFKYSSISEILSEITLLHSLWSGDTGSITPSTRLIAIAGEADELSSSRCRALAGQILYRHGGSILILPLGYINDYTFGESEKRGWFRRLMYMIDSNRDFAPESFTFTDSYGVSYLRLSEGINPLSELPEEYLNKLIGQLGRHYSTVILDVGTCFSPVNLRTISAADNILFFGSGRRISDISLVFGEETMEKVRVIGTGDVNSEELIMDDCVSELYGRDDQETDDTKVQKRNR